MSNNLPLSEQYYEAGKEWAELHAGASLLEEGKSAYVSQRMAALGDIPVSQAEKQVKASSDYSDYLKKMVRLRERANLAKINLEVLKMRFWEAQSEAATERAVSKL